MFQWITIFMMITALGSLLVGADQISQFNNNCTDNGIELTQCWGDRLNEMWRN